MFDFYMLYLEHKGS